MSCWKKLFLWPFCRRGPAVEVTFAQGKGIEIGQVTYSEKGVSWTLRQGMSSEEVVASMPEPIRQNYMNSLEPGRGAVEWEIRRRDRCFLAADVKHQEVPFISPGYFAKHAVEDLIHLPGLRGNPERAYPKTGVSLWFPGTFESYAASVIADWQTQEDKTKVEQLSDDLKDLGLTWRVAAKPIDDTRYELYVGRLCHEASGGEQDLVNIADAGFGVSQVLPLLVALHVAEPGQMVYVEQPELHLHPRAQSALALVLANAAKRGVRVVAETHSSLLLLGVQSLVAEGKLPEDLVNLHWFTRDKGGSTTVDSAELDKAGRFGDWPQDFGQVDLEMERRYLDAVDALHLKE